MSDPNPDNTVILYKCPYCLAGRFTKVDGWDTAVKHIKDKHSKNRRYRVKNSYPQPIDFNDNDEMPDMISFDEGTAGLGGTW
jgi:hypothetical protein